MFSYSKRCRSFCEWWAEATLHIQHSSSSACGRNTLWGRRSQPFGRALKTNKKSVCLWITSLMQNFRAQFPIKSSIRNKGSLISVTHTHLCWSWCVRSRSGTVGRECSWVGCWQWCGDTAHRKSGHRADRCEGRCRCQGTQHRSGLPCPLFPPHCPATTPLPGDPNVNRNTCVCATTHGASYFLCTASTLESQHCSDYTFI